MKLLTTNQKNYLKYKPIKIGKKYTIPFFGIIAYYDNKDINNHNYTFINDDIFVVTHIDKKYCKGYLLKNNTGISDSIYLNIEELTHRDFLEIIILTILTIIPFSLYNLYQFIKTEIVK
jgi:hypothetical protein